MYWSQWTASVCITITVLTIIWTASRYHYKCTDHNGLPHCITINVLTIMDCSNPTHQCGDIMDCATAPHLLNDHNGMTQFITLWLWMYWPWWTDFVEHISVLTTMGYSNTHQCTDHIGYCNAHQCTSRMGYSKSNAHCCTDHNGCNTHWPQWAILMHISALTTMGYSNTHQCTDHNWLL